MEPTILILFLLCWLVTFLMTREAYDSFFTPVPVAKLTWSWRKAEREDHWPMCRRSSFALGCWA
jgi:hypothetical protein